MFSIALSLTMATAPATPDGLFRNRAKAGCSGAQATSYAVVQQTVPVAHVAAGGCSGTYGVGTYAHRAFRTPVRSLFSRKAVVVAAAPVATYSVAPATAPPPAKAATPPAPKSTQSFLVVPAAPAYRTPVRSVLRVPCPSCPGGYRYIY